MNYHIKTNYDRLLADTTTPVAIYLRLRDVFPNSVLLESSEYQSRDNNVSYICCEPVAGIELDATQLRITYPGTAIPDEKPASAINIRRELADFKKAFIEDATLEANSRLISNGLFGYFTFGAIPYLDTYQEDLSSPKPTDEIPLLKYHLYRYVIAIDHFHNNIHIYEHTFHEEASELERLRYLIQNKNFPEYAFRLESEETSNMSDDDFTNLVATMKKHIYRGDVFQIVPSRSFSRDFSGDEFNVYRALRSINPSPYLFYFDYGNFKLFGSSPEAQLTIKHGVASVFPIAGTFKRTGKLSEDLLMAEKLKQDPKEKAEHVMLVDLARNDLSKNSRKVHVSTDREAQFYSHVIHLVSKVSGEVPPDKDGFEIAADTFPAGTLSGAPKHRAIELINQYEKQSRGFYSGAIGYMGLQQEFNHAIMIRSFMSRQNCLIYQAGAGIVANSVPELELQEVYNKIAALRNALQYAEKIH